MVNLFVERRLKCAGEFGAVADDMKLERGYFNWLCNKVYGDNEHERLLSFLFEEPFRWVIPMDENRAKDGEWLREIYCNELEIDENSLDFLGSCTVLEMMIAIAIHIEDDTMYDPEIGDRTGLWFWMMIQNLGLFDMRDDVFDKEMCQYKVDIFLERRYLPDGKGSLFPLRNPPTGVNVRDLVISDQKNLWLMENYDFDDL